MGFDHAAGMPNGHPRGVVLGLRTTLEYSSDRALYKTEQIRSFLSNLELPDFYGRVHVNLFQSKSL